MLPSRLHNLLLALLLVLPVAAHSAPRRTENAREQRRALQAAERARAAQTEIARQAEERARAAEDEHARLTETYAAAANELRAAEEETLRIAEQIDALDARRRTAEVELARRAQALAPLLPLMQRMSMYPAETLLAVPASPEDTLRGMLLLQGLGQHLQAEAAGIRNDQAAIEAMSDQLLDRRTAMQAALDVQHGRAHALDQQRREALGRRTEAQGVAEDAMRQAAAEASRAGDIREAIARIESERRAAEARAREEAARALREQRQAEAEEAANRAQAAAQPTGRSVAAGTGRMSVPVAGRILTNFGERDRDGVSQGIVWQTAPGGRVSAPCSGRVMYAGPFRSFGVLLIVDCGSGFHIVLAGLNRLDTRVGASVAAGEPVGAMADGDQAHRLRLTLELRQNGQPVNPASWLRARG